MKIKLLKRKKHKKNKKNKQMSKKVVTFKDQSETSLLLISPSYEEPISEVEANLNEARGLLYYSHFAARFTEIGWQFCNIIFLTALTGYQSLTLVSTYGLFTGLVICFTGPSIGKYVDSIRYTRLEIAQVFIWVQNLSVVVATVCCFVLLKMVNQEDIDSSAEANRISNFIPSFNMSSFGLLVGIHVFGAIAKLTDAGMTVAMERDWIVVMSKSASHDIIDDYDDDDDDDDDDDEEFQGSSNSISTGSSAFYSVGSISVGPGTTLNKNIIRKLKENTWLSQTNTTMKQIDLLCKVGGPAAAGIYLAAFDNNDASNNITSDIAHFRHLSYAAIIIGLLNLLSLWCEYVCTLKIYDLIPSLAYRGTEDDQKVKIKNDKVESPESDNGGCGFVGNFKLGIPQSLSIFFEQPIAPGGVALALLYLNILTFGGIMTAYLVWLHVSYNTIGILRGISSLIGLFGTLVYGVLSRSKGLALTGLGSLMFQFGFLGLCYISLYVKTLYWSLWLLVVGVCCSRIGLWAFDLTITQYMQQEIPENIRGVIGGVQKSLNGFFDLATYALGLIYSDPKDFHVLVSIGYCSVGIALVTYYFGVYKKKDSFDKDY